MILEREKKCLAAISQVYTYNPVSGKIFDNKGKEMTSKSSYGYTMISVKVEGKYLKLRGHQFAWYYIYKECVELLDHKNEIKDDNRIDNLRKSSKQENAFNQSWVKGYSFCKKLQKFTAYIKSNGKKKHLGVYDKEEDARNAYVEEKKKLHTYTDNNG